MVGTIFNSPHRVIQDCTRSWVFRHFPSKLEDSCVDPFLHHYKPDKYVIFFIVEKLFFYSTNKNISMTWDRRLTQSWGCNQLQRV